VSRTTAQQVVLKLIQDAGGVWEGKRRLDKGFYFAHLYYAEERPGLLTDWPIARLPQGPGIDKRNSLVHGLEHQGYLTAEDWNDGPYPDVRFRLTDKGAQAINLPDDTRKSIKEAADFCKGKSGPELSQYTHDNSRSWRRGQDGDILDIYIDLITDDEEYETERAKMQLLNQALAQALEQEGA